MGRSKRYNRVEDEEREERILAQIEAQGRIPTPPPGHYHETGEKQRRRKDRKNERTRLKEMTREYNG